MSLTGTTDNGVITLNGSAPNATVESNMTFNGTDLQVTGRLLVNSTATTGSIDTSARSLTDASNKTSILWHPRNLIDNAGGITVDWQNNRLTFGANTSLDWRSGKTYDPATSQSISWVARELWDADPNNNGFNTGSLDWNYRIAKDTDAVSSIDWGARSLTDRFSLSSLDWNSRVLTTPASNTALNWSENDYLDSNVYQRDYKSRVTQNSVSNNLNNAYSSYLGDLIEVDGSDVVFDGAVADGMLVYLGTDATWYPVTQNSTTATKMLGIACNVTAGAGFVLLEGHVVITDTGTSGPHVTGADHGLPVYIEDNTTTGQMSCTIPSTTGGNHVIRILGHCYWNNAGDTTLWMMKFRPSNNWVQI